MQTQYTPNVARKLARRDRARALAVARLYDALAQCDDPDLSVAMRYGHGRIIAARAWHYREVA